MDKQLSLIIINQQSGNSKSYLKFCKWIRQNPTHLFLIQECHSMNLLQTLDSYDISKIIIFGGDGTIHFCLQELMTYSKQIPIEILPAGSGNGLWHSFQLPNFLTITADSYRCCQLPLLTITNEIDQSIRYCMNAISWGFISNVDLHTEWMRRIGNLRFDIGALWYLLRKQTYQGTLRYTDIHDEEHIVTGKFFNMWICNLPITSKNVYSSPNSVTQDYESFWINYIQAPISRCELANIFLSISKPHYIHKPSVNYVQAKHFELTITEGELVIDGEKLISKHISGKKDKSYTFQCSSL